MTEDVLVSVPSVLVWCCWVGGVMYLEECEEGEPPRSTFFPPPPRVSMLQPRLVPAFFGCETSQVSTCTYLTLHVLIGPFFQSPNYIT